MEHKIAVTISAQGKEPTAGEAIIYECLMTKNPPALVRSLASLSSPRLARSSSLSSTLSRLG